jgi:predicted dehydrogenase
MVGFNRRFAQATAHLKRHFDGIAPLSVDYRFAPGEIAANAWPQDMEVGGGRIIGEACHAIDLCAALHDSTPVRVFAESVAKVGGIETTDDRVFITTRHANGGISNISYQAGGDRSGPTERIEVFGGGRTAVVEGWDTVEMWARNRRTKARGGKDKGHSAGLAAFVDACRSGGAWPIPWEHVYATTWASLAAVQSLRTGLPVNVEDGLDS